MDWNNDGKKDLITGEGSGNIRIYLNTGTDEDPLFSGFAKLQVNGVDFDCGSSSMPHVVDWNNDGNKDVLCGDNMGRVVLLLNTGTDANPVFTSREYLRYGYYLVDAGATSSPTVVDWNRDGKKDLLLGGDSGRVLYFENTGTDESPAFDGFSYLYADGSLLKVYSYARIDVKDWDNDGVMDLISGSRNYDGPPDPEGGVTYFHSLGPLSIQENAIHQDVGGIIDFSLRAGSDKANLAYILLGSVSGTEPGLHLPGGGTLPLIWDPFTDLVMAAINTPFFSNFMATLDGAGESTAQFNTWGPIPPGNVGVVLYFAYAVNTKPWGFASNPVAIEIVP